MRHKFCLLPFLWAASSICLPSVFAIFDEIPQICFDGSSWLSCALPGAIRRCHVESRVLSYPKSIYMSSWAELESHFIPGTELSQKRKAQKAIYEGPVFSGLQINTEVIEIKKLVFFRQKWFRMLAVVWSFRICCPQSWKGVKLERSAWELCYCCNKNSTDYGDGWRGKEKWHDVMEEPANASCGEMARGPSPSFYWHSLSSLLAPQPLIHGVMVMPALHHASLKH